MRYLILSLLLLAPTWAIAAQPAGTLVGTVVRQTGEASVTTPEERLLTLGGGVRSGEVISTGPDARLKVAMIDGTRLLLGERSLFALDQFALEPGGTTSFRMVEGAFRLITGAVMSLPESRLTVATPLGDIGIRGTDFWGGWFEPGEVGVFLFSGRPARVENALGAVELALGTGTLLHPGAAPTEPAEWSPERLGRAASSVTFDDDRP